MRGHAGRKRGSLRCRRGVSQEGVHQAAEAGAVHQRSEAEPVRPGPQGVEEQVRSLRTQAQRVAGRREQPLAVHAETPDRFLGEQEMGDVGGHGGVPVVLSTSFADGRNPCSAAVAQLVEQGTENPCVNSSILFGGILFE